MSNIALKLEGLSKTYPGNVEALKNISLQVESGDFYALLGPNGAGKSTAIGIISSLVTKTAGKVEILGIDIDKNHSLAKKKLGVVGQEVNFNQFETVYQVLSHQAGYYGITAKEVTENSHYYLKALGLWDKRNEQGRNLSGGMKRRLMVAKALVNNPDLLILDEPSAGVDIELRRSLWDFLREINEKGTTIILTTHYLEEAEKLCKNISIINEGSIVKTSSMNSLLSELETQNYLFELKNSFPHNVDHARFNFKLLSDHLISVNVNQENSLNQIINFFSENNIEVFNMTNETNRLEELFLNLTNKK
ncbi:ABC transporter ATP-binding protein [SAR86 cluster bacterium]|nr:ABC transporter ATP-binding protein [SAR86 cluster bacterium]